MSAPPELCGIFSDALAEVLAVSTGAQYHPVSVRPGETLCAVAGMMTLAGQKHGLLLIHASEAAMREVYTLMTGADDVTDADITDTACEIVNMTAGSAKLRLGGSDYAFSLTTPLVIKGDGMSLFAKQRVSVFDAALECAGSLIHIKLVY
ncbi:MAG: chemotaxis protein CheX [Oscillospiraceae bacterium]|jgi:CheY-specific phosphatase CheX|nr:chemotaxis protein CheX [Oscillospiraceae bacterium]